MSTLKDTKEFVELRTYKNRIEELNTIIGDLTEENEKIKVLLDKNTKSITQCICKYTPYMISDAISDVFNIKISGRAIVKMASENNLFKHDFLALRIPRKRYTKDKCATTVIFSAFGVLCLRNFLIENCTINPDRPQNALEIAIQEMNDGKLIRV